MIDSESREDLPRTLGRGEGITSLPAASPPFLRVLYEGGRPYRRAPFNWNICLKGLIAPGTKKKGPRGSKG